MALAEVAAEVPLVELDGRLAIGPDRFVDRAQFRHREHGLDESGPERGVFQPGSDPFERILDDARVVERKRRPLDVCYRDECGVCRIASAPQRRQPAADRYVRDRDYPHPWIAIRVPVAAELLQVPGTALAQARLFLEFPRRGLIEVLVRLHEPAGQRPVFAEWFLAASDERDV